MALISCPDCGKPVSSEAKACPGCGYPIAEKLAGAEIAEQPASSATGELLAEVRPSWWGYFWHWFFFFLIVPPIIAAIQRSCTVLRVYAGRVSVERGLFNKCYQDYDPRDIRSIDIDQSFFQRMVGIGDLTISTSATVEAAEVLKSIPDPKGLRDLIIGLRSRRS